jgi:hypothetical protein
MHELDVLRRGQQGDRLTLFIGQGYAGDVKRKLG